MAPTIVTAEYKLLRELADYPTTGRRSDKLNQLTLTKVDNNGYVRYQGNYVFLTDAGYDRIEAIEDGK